MSLPSQSGPILDYASPRRRQKARLPSRSRIVINSDHGEFLVREWIEAKNAAYFALGVATLSLCSLAGIFVGECLSIGTLRHFWHSDLRSQIVFIAALWLSEMIVMLLVINDTWRETMLEARSNGLLLGFFSPFTRRQFEWNADQIEDIRVVLTSKLLYPDPLGELEVHVAGNPVAQLFTDHPLAELKRIAEGILRSIGSTSLPKRDTKC